MNSFISAIVRFAGAALLVLAFFLLGTAWLLLYHPQLILHLLYAGAIFACFLGAGGILFSLLHPILAVIFPPLSTKEEKPTAQ